MTTPPSDRWAWCVRVAVAVLAASAAPTASEACTIWTSRDGADVHFDPSDMPIPVYVQVDGSADFPDSDDELRAIEAALETWSQVLCGEDEGQLVFEYMGVLDTDPENYDPGLFRDEKNLISFINEGWPYDPLTIATTRVQFEQDTGRILEFGIALNDQWTDWATQDGGKPDTFDVQAVMMRELGLIMGLGDSEVDSAVMSPFFVEANDSKRTLSNDDVAAICELYAPGREDWSMPPEDAVCAREPHPFGAPPTNNSTVDAGMDDTSGGADTSEPDPLGVGESCSSDSDCGSGLSCGCPESLGDCATDICFEPEGGGGGSDSGCATVAAPRSSPLAALLALLAFVAGWRRG
ncbi:MAG: hypothetical protein CMH57_11380 [Myxococcales bacterium]|nr:hypothetical protein [Myxococcales bacterium]